MKEHKLPKYYEDMRELGREEREKEILEIIDEWWDGYTILKTDVEILKQKIKENKGKWKNIDLKK